MSIDVSFRVETPTRRRRRRARNTTAAAVAALGLLIAPSPVVNLAQQDATTDARVVDRGVDTGIADVDRDSVDSGDFLEAVADVQAADRASMAS